MRRAIIFALILMSVGCRHIREQESLAIVAKYSGRIGTIVFDPSTGRESPPKQVVITNAVQYGVFVSRLPRMEPLNTKGDDHPSDDPLLKMPPVDFTKQMIIAVTRETMYLPPDINHVHVTGKTIVVEYSEEDLGETAYYQQDQGLGTYCAVLVQRSDKSVVFKGTVTKTTQPAGRGDVQ